MTTLEQAEKLYKKYRVKYFEKHFIGKDIDESIYETSRSIILELTAIYAKVGMLIDCLSALRSDKNYFNRLDADCKRRFKTNIIGLKSIRRRLNDILEPISQGLQAE